MKAITEGLNEIERKTKCGVCGNTHHNKYHQCIPCLRRRNRQYYYKMKALKIANTKEAK